MRFRIKRTYEVNLSQGKVEWRVSICADKDADKEAEKVLAGVFNTCKRGWAFNREGLFYYGYASSLSEAQQDAREVCDDFVSCARRLLSLRREVEQAGSEEEVVLYVLYI